MNEKWVDTQAVADYLAKPRSWILNNSERVGLPRHKLGNQFRYRLSEIDAWLETQR